MAELLVRVVSKKSDDPYIDVQLTKRGDVIAAMKDGHEWTPTEKTASYWRIIKVPGLSIAEAEALTVPEPGDPKQNKMLQRLAFHLDLDSPEVPAELRAYIDDGDRKQEAIVFDDGVELIRTLKTEKPAKQDPAVIGPMDPEVIGK